MLEKLDMKKKKKNNTTIKTDNIQIYRQTQLKHPKTFWGQSKTCSKGNVKYDA